MAKTQKNKPSNSKKLVRVVVPKFLEMINTIKLYHWKTSSYATHKATDELLSDLNSKTDEFVEILLANEFNRNQILKFSSIKVTAFTTNVECRKQIDKYIKCLLDLNINKEMSVDLLNLRDEIVGLLNKFLYLLTLA